MGAGGRLHFVWFGIVWYFPGTHLGCREGVEAWEYGGMRCTAQINQTPSFVGDWPIWNCRLANHDYRLRVPQGQFSQGIRTHLGAATCLKVC